MDLSTVQRRIERMEEFEAEIRTAKEAIKSELENDENYMETRAVAKEVNTKKRNIKEQILNRESNQKLTEVIKQNNDEIRMIKEILADELMEHYQATQTNEITDASGAPRKFVLTVKMLPKQGNKKNFSNFDNL